MPRKTPLLLRMLWPWAPAALLTLAVCRLISSPPSFLLSQEQRFVRFTEEVFREELSANTLNLHYTVADPSSFGIRTGEATLGSGSLKARQEAAAAAENYYTALTQFDPDSLSDQRRLTYDVFSDYLETELSAAGLLLYDEPLGPTLGIQTQLPVLFAEYTFRTKGDIEDYLSLLSQIPDYFASLLSFEQEKAAAGLFMDSGCACGVAEQCMKFAAQGEHSELIDVFDEKIDAITNLTADEKIAYKSRNASIVTGSVLPAYEELARGIAALDDGSSKSMGLFYDPEGTAYYRYLVRSRTGDSRSIEEIEEAIKTQMVSDYTDLQKLSGSQTGQDAAAEQQTADEFHAVQDTEVQTADGSADAPADSGSTGVPADSSSTGTPKDNDNTEIQGTAESKAMLEDLRLKIMEDFPLLTEVDCEVKTVRKSMQEYLSPAFYLTSAIDDYSRNVIYINPASQYSSLELYTTLAHEGYPGHLYQTVYFASQSPDLLRMILDVGGYTEGWATYVEMYSYSFWEEDPFLATVSQKNRSFMLGLASLLDIGIHYRGYTPEEVGAFLSRLGFEKDAGASLYQAILEAPANYLQYYVGYLNFQSLYDTWQQRSGSFSAKEFHRCILETGPAPFALLEQQLEKKLG